VVRVIVAALDQFYETQTKTGLAGYNADFLVNQPLNPWRIALQIHEILVADPT